jgi:multidrug resistance efflux pump
MSVKLFFRQVAIVAVAVLIGLAAVVKLRPRTMNGSPAPILGVVHQTEIRVASETSGRLVSIKVRPGDKVHRGEVLAVLSSPELTVAVDEAEANAAAARTDRANVDAGVRSEESRKELNGIGGIANGVVEIHHSVDASTSWLAQCATLSFRAL